jgi:hypothetical protein
MSRSLRSVRLALPPARRFLQRFLRAEGFEVSKETLRRWMSEAGLWQASKAGGKKLHPPRPRRARLRELVQIDGSLHDWFEPRFVIRPACAFYWSSVV